MPPAAPRLPQPVSSAAGRTSAATALVSCRCAQTPECGQSARNGRAKDDQQSYGINAHHHTIHALWCESADGDNVQWLLNDFTTQPLWWASPSRGTVPLGWTLSPALVDLAPVVAAYLNASASATDDFVAAPSGLGYTYPDIFPPSLLGDFVAATADYMARSPSAGGSGMRLVNVLAQDYNEAAASAYLAAPGIDGLIWYDYSR